MQFLTKKMAENKSEIKPFLFKKYIYCVCVLNTDLVSDDSSFQRGKLTGGEGEIKNQPTDHTL